eukprot:13455692-Ditylum_brightwellii.AAC.1
MAIKIKSLQKRSVAALNKMDELVDRYHVVMEALLGKIVLVDEEIILLDAGAEEINQGRVGVLWEHNKWNITM